MKLREQMRLLNTPECRIEILHDPSDLTTWRLVESKRIVPGIRKTIRHLVFIDREQAVAAAREIVGALERKVPPVV